ncbi:6972_t:CDS:10 [Entrophospora sp. SA101]|nr:6972_t:CDS:10 [Entrophospora sp. SA101]
MTQEVNNKSNNVKRELETQNADTFIDREPDSKKIRLQGNQNRNNSSDLYLDTINRHMLDFDFEKVCSVSLSNLNVYACLVCGKYFQGRGRNSHAYFHSLHEDHHVFINLHTLKVIKDSSLDDIKYVLHPTFTKEQVAQLDQNTKHSYDLNNKKYLPGFVGLNNVKANDYVNVIIQALAHIPPLRDYFMLQNFENKSQLVQRFSTLVKKIWNPRAFKGQVSPHELLQEISNASNKRFKLAEQADPLDFLSWFLNTLHKDLCGTKKSDSSIIYKIFQGEVKVESQSIITKDNTDEKDRQLFDVDRGCIINNTSKESAGALKRFQLISLPNYLIFHIKRFTKNNWDLEKNPTIVNFPIKNIDMKDLLENPESEMLDTHYDLIANICHEGKAGKSNGIYKVHVQHRGKEQWYQIQDLIVEEINAQMIFLSESYIQSSL